MCGMRHGQRLDVCFMPCNKLEMLYFIYYIPLCIILVGCFVTLWFLWGFVGSLST